MVEFLASRRDEEVRRVNIAYALNTAGGVVGVASAIGVLLVVVGVRGSSYLAAAISASCGVLGWVLDAALGPQTRSPKGISGGPKGVAVTSSRLRLMVLASVSGFLCCST